MTRKVTVWLALITVLLAACVSASQGSAKTAVPDAQVNRPTPSPPTLRSPDLPSYTGCYYVWATRELPALTETIQTEFAQLNGEIRASAYAFGEECRGDDGTVSFLPMETDFRVRIPVTTLGDDAALGLWISRAMSVVEAHPAAELPGTRPGRVEFEFYVDESTGLRLSVEISRYRNEAGSLDSASIFRLFREGR
jgi:hypothetical protein